MEVSTIDALKDKRRQGEVNCSQKGLQEEMIKNAFVMCMHELAGNFDSVRDVLNASIRKVLDKSQSEEVRKLEDQISKLQDKMMEFHKKQVNDEISEETYKKEGIALSNKIDELKNKKEQVEVSVNTTNLVKMRLEEITEAIGNIVSMTSFNELIFRRLVESITVN